MFDLDDIYFNVNCNFDFYLMYGGREGGRFFYFLVFKVEFCILLNENQNNILFNENYDKVMCVIVIDKINLLLRRNYWNSKLKN